MTLLGVSNAWPGPINHLGYPPGNPAPILEPRPAPRRVRRLMTRKFAGDWLLPLGVVAVWFVLSRWVLPRAGFPSCTIGACAAPARSGPPGFPTNTSHPTR